VQQKITRPVTGPHFFLELVATFQALLLTLVGPTSPIYQDIDRLHNWARNAYTEQKLQALRREQPNWFAYVIWAITVESNAYFKQSLSLDDIISGVRLTHPLQHIFPTLFAFSTFTQPNPPPEIMPIPAIMDNRKRPIPPYNDDDDTKSPKRPRTDNKQVRTTNTPPKLYKLRMTVQKVVAHAPLARVLHAGGHDIPTLIRTSGVPITTCCRLAFWGTCAEQNCHLSHDPVTLSPETIDKVAALLQPGVTKMVATPAQIN